ncbi:MAG: hypothetical protein RLZ83_517 [Pseudomonadota bacterium]|jgi:ABC-type uncharacterized transport system permease subunit
MILPTGVAGGWLFVLACAATVAYILSLTAGARLERWALRAFPVGVAAHVAMVLLEIGSLGVGSGQVRLGFGPVLSLTVCLTLAVHAIGGHLTPTTSVRRTLAVAGVGAVLLGLLFPGEAKVLGSPWAPVHWLLGVASYALFGAAVLHGVLLDGAERRLRGRKGRAGAASGVPLLQLERITFRFVQAGFTVLTAAMLLGLATATVWRWDHKTVLSLVAWAIFAALLAGRHFRGWRGQQATRWLYAGVLALLLAYVGSRFVVEVLM